MSKITFRTADGRVVTFSAGKGKGRRKNPSWSPRYRAQSRVAAAVDAADKAKHKARRAASKATKAKAQAKAVKRTVKRTTKRAVRLDDGCRDVKFRGGPKVTFCRPAGSDKARKRRVAKTVLSDYRFVKGKPLTAPAALRGKRNGQVFTHGGKTYRMISYAHPSTGTRVRYAMRVKASAK